MNDGVLTLTAGARHLRLHWPPTQPEAGSDNFFLGAFDARRSLHVSWAKEPDFPVIDCHGRNWYLASAVSSDQQGLVHNAGGAGAVGFRGYVLPDIQSYSSSGAITSYWLEGPERRHDGVFSVASISGADDVLTLDADLLGMGTLYWRELDSTVLFSTNPRFLACAGDAPDGLAWRCLIQSSWIAADRSLTQGIRRVPAGQAIRVTAAGITIGQSRLDTVPPGTRRMDRRTLGEIEEVFQQALDRCVRLSANKLMLPLSSGFDSRRILAGLVKRQAPFTAVTCRLIQSERMDLDARFASAMARDFNFDHAVVEAAEDRYLADDLMRRTLLDGESVEHTWAIRVLHGAPTRYHAVLDGIAGDVLGDPVGWTEQLGVSLPGTLANGEMDEVASRAIGTEFDNVLADSAWHSAEQVREDLRKYLTRFYDRPNAGELSFLLLRQRRAVALWSQHLSPPGVLPLYPYLDPDYLSLLLSISSGDKHISDIQRSCLREFWPRFAQYPGTRDIPAGLRPEMVATEKAHSAACQKQLRHEISHEDADDELRQLLTPKGWLALQASRVRRWAPRWRWYLTPVMELASRQARSTAVWEVQLH